MATEHNMEQTSHKKAGERSEAKPDQLREDIARTRSALSDDVKALGERLRPDQLKADAKEVIHHATDAAREGARHMVHDAKEAALDSLRSAKDHAFDSISDSVQLVGTRARRAGHAASDFVAAHAIPLSLLGAGVGWLLISLSYQRRRLYLGDGRYGSQTWESARERAEQLGHRAASALTRTGERIVERGHELGDRAADLRTQVTDTASHLGHEAAELGRQAYRGIERSGSRAIEVSEKNPLAVGLFAFAAGAVVALLLPPTRRENELLGQTRDRLVEGAQRSAGELKSSVKRGIERGIDDVREVIDEVTQPGSRHA
jgi:Protein of unknown function (DUF3618)